MTARRILAALGGVLGIGLVAAWLLVFSPLPVMDEATAALASDDRVTVTTEPDLTFAPAEGEATTGFVFLVGARVPPEAYAPWARMVAEAGYLVVIPCLPLHFAILDTQAAASVFEDHPEVVSWAVGGHSLGGAMAARFAATSTETDGLVLLAAYPESSLDLSDADLEVVVVSGTNDAIASADEIEDGLTRLPATTVHVRLDGANHAGFGWYGEQSGDGPAEMDRKDQTQATAAAIIALLEAIAP